VELIVKSFFNQSEADSSSMVVTESNGDGVLGLDSGEIWPAEMDTKTGSPSSLSLEEKVVEEAAIQLEDISTVEDRLVVDLLEEQMLEEKHNCEPLSPQSELDEAETDPTEFETIIIAPLDGSQAELRSRVIKEVRKPGRSEYKPLRHDTCFFSNLIRIFIRGKFDVGLSLRLCLCALSQTARKYSVYCSR